MQNNTEIEFIKKLIEKYKLDEEKLIKYILKNIDKSYSIKLFYSGLLFKLSINQKNIIQKLSNNTISHT
jgi:hypothetical protein